MPPPRIAVELPLLDSRRGERADAVRNRAAILSAAGRLVADRGADEVTMDEVACAAGVGKGTLFRRFGDRPGLLRALLDEHERAFQEGFIRGAAPLGPGPPAIERLVAFGHGLVDLIEKNGDLLAAAEHGAPGRRMRHRVYIAYRTHVAVLLREAAPASDVEYLTDALLGALATELVLFQRRELEMSVERIKHGWSRLIERALASPTAPD
ncbi:MAG: TetR/AcrR family transcriptional regulator [Solirubrobacteraceae bacterium]